METKKKITDVKCLYTGGNIWTYSARFGDLWLDGRLDECVEVYTDNPLDEEGCLKENVGFLMTEEEAPTWLEILKSILDDDALTQDVEGAVVSLVEYNGRNLYKHSNEYYDD